MTLLEAIVTVRGVRRTAHAAFVEFEYALADGELAVELIMPIAALREFRAARDAQLRFTSADAERAYNELAAGCDARSAAPP